MDYYQAGRSGSILYMLVHVLLLPEEKRTMG